MKRRNRAQDTNEEDDELKVNCDEIKTWNLFRFLEEEKKLQFERLNNLQKKLAILRVADLQEILNRERVPFNKYARKDDLQKRMIDVLNNRDNSSSLKERIKKGIIQAYSKMWVGGFYELNSDLKLFISSKSIAPNRTKTPPLPDDDMYATPYTNTLVSISYKYQLNAGWSSVNAWKLNTIVTFLGTCNCTIQQCINGISDSARC